MSTGLPSTIDVVRQQTDTEIKHIEPSAEITAVLKPEKTQEETDTQSPTRWQRPLM